MWESIIAVLGTLGGVAVSGLLSRAARAEEWREQHRREAVEALARLGQALADHRRAMWEVTHARLCGEPDARVRELRDESHRTRSMITAPATKVRLLIGRKAPEVWEAAKVAIGATYQMRDATDLDDLEAKRQRALDTSDELMDVAAVWLERA